MYQYPAAALKAKFSEIIRQHLPDKAFDWLQQREALTDTAAFNTSFITLPRRVGKAAIVLTPDDASSLAELRPSLDIAHWTTDRLCRVWLLLHLDPTPQQPYVNRIESLFLAAEMNELVALYSALPLLAYPEQWIRRCIEGIRSNIGSVLEAIMCRNPYPSEQLPEPAWNQLVLKAFFTEKPVDQIIGIDQRANPALAHTLSDYAHERWAAHRLVNPMLWQCVGKFIDASIVADIEKIAASGDPLEREAAALACYDSPYQPARHLLTEPQRSAIASGEWTWNQLAQKTREHVLQP